jgi:D-alanyl-D-alanine carboxypeptidase (penicillin-binding protein 5/6)
MMPAPPQLAAKSYVLMDASSGNVLVENNGDERLPPASLTKLMTAYIATLDIRRGQIGENDPVTVSENAWRTGGSRMFIKVGSQVTVSDLLHGIIIQSGNDASGRAVRAHRRQRRRVRRHDEQDGCRPGHDQQPLHEPDRPAEP